MKHGFVKEAVSKSRKTAKRLVRLRREFSLSAQDLWKGPAVVFVAAVLSLWPCAVQGGVHFQRLKSFGFPGLVEQTPGAALLQASDGALYGTTVGGDVNLNFGTVFKVNADGSGYSVLYRFGTTDSAAQSPRAALVQGSDGFLYGTTSSGGTAGAGTVFRLGTNGSGYSVLHSFGTSSVEGRKPVAALLQASDGALYGTTMLGGSSSNGTVFKLNLDGSGYQILHHFGGGGDSGFPTASLIEGTNGTLFGTASGLNENAAYYYGTAFKIRTNGSGYVVLHTFTGDVNFGGADGAVPLAALTRGSDGKLYGTTMRGGNSYSSQSYGTLFKLNQDGTGYSVLVNFGLIGFGGAFPSAPMIEGNDGMLYGTTIDRGFESGIVPTAFRVNKNGSGFATLHSFSSYAGQGENPPNALIQAGNGLIYGTVQKGGVNGYGFIFRLKPDGSNYTVLRNCIGRAGGDAQNPDTSLVEGSDGAIYGATVDNGYGADSAPVIFKLNKDGNGYRILHTFAGYGGAGQFLAAALTAGRDGRLYGTGQLLNQVFGLNQDGSGYSVLHTFGLSTNDGQQPYAASREATNGVLFGTTLRGGTGGYGTVFKLNKDGSGYSILHEFRLFDGESPMAKLLEGPDGALYGTTAGGGASYPNNGGTLFKLNKDGSGFATLHYFTSSPGEGRGPRAELVQGRNGALYGTTDYGGTSNYGTIFRLNHDGSGYQVMVSFAGTAQYPHFTLVGAQGKLFGTEQGGWDYFNNPVPGKVFSINEDGSGYTVLQTFSNSVTQGLYLSAALLPSVDGTFYGITQYGGDLDMGTVFRLWPAETPELLNLNVTNGVAAVHFAGTSGANYRIFRSPDLSNWTGLATISMPASGAYTYLEPTGPSQTAFYRVGWVP